MTDGPDLPPPTNPAAPTPVGAESWWKQKRAKLPTWAWILIGVVVLIGIAGALTPDAEEDASDTTTEATPSAIEPDDTEPVETEVADTEPEQTTPDTDAPTTEAPTTTAAPTTTRAPTTTVDPGAQADMVAITMLGNLRDGDPATADLAAAMIDAIEPYPLDRVDVLSGFLDDVGTANLVIVATSGYGTDEYQIEAAVTTVSAMSELWDTPPFAGLGAVKVGLDLTVDGRQYVIPHDAMLGVLNRQITPQQALGLA